jgi:L-ribulose-5-phosphate 3-epimerase UlaE
VRGASKGRLQTSFKNNRIDYKRILKVMKDTGYNGYLGIEYIWTDWEKCNEVDNVAEIIQFRDYLKAEMNNM